jgi:hypothetical protein
VSGEDLLDELVDAAQELLDAEAYRAAHPIDDRAISRFWAARRRLRDLVARARAERSPR